MLFLIILLLLIIVNAYFSAAEIALVSVKKFRIQEEADKGNKNAKQILGFLKSPDEYLSSIQVGITLVGIIEGLYGGEVLQEYLEPKFLLWGVSAWFSHVLSLILGVGLITFVTIVIGELLPKSLALQFPQKIALGIAPTFSVFNLIAYPFVKFLTWSTHLLVQLLHIKGSENKKLTDADLKALLSLAYRQGTIGKNEWLFHQNIFNFYDETIGNMMTPFADVIWIEENMSSEKVEDTLRKSVHNYFPVVSEKNKVIGYLCAKNFFMERNKSLKQLVQSACIVTQDQTAPDLLEKFKSTNNNFGVVAKTNGELAGVVTLHDLGEILIGHIP